MVYLPLSASKLSLLVICCCLYRWDKCENLVLQAPVRDKLEPVVFLLNISIQEQKPKARRAVQNLDSYPIFSQEQKLTQTAEVGSVACTILAQVKTVNDDDKACWNPTHSSVRCVILWFHFLQINFKKECGLDNKCSSNLQMTAQFADEKGEIYPRWVIFWMMKPLGDQKSCWSIYGLAIWPSGAICKIWTWWVRNSQGNNCYQQNLKEPQVKLSLFDFTELAVSWRLE